MIERLHGHHAAEENRQARLAEWRSERDRIAGILISGAPMSPERKQSLREDVATCDRRIRELERGAQDAGRGT